MPDQSPLPPDFRSADESPSLLVTPVESTRHPSFALTHPYVELVYASTLGPTAVLLARSLGRLIAESGAPIGVPATALALELGLRSARESDPLGRRSPFRKAVDRLAHERLVRWVATDHLVVYTAAPAVSDRVRRQLPPTALRAHDHFLREWEAERRT